MLHVLVILPLLFLFAFIAFYIPGSLFTKKLLLQPLSRIVVACILGATLWGWQGWIFGWLHLRELSYVYLLVTSIIWLKVTIPQLKTFRIKRLLSALSKEKILLILLLLGLIIQLPAAWFFGLVDAKGISLTSFMPPDHEWHASLIHQLTQSIPPNQPGMYGETVTNYHYFGDMIIAELVRVFQTPLMLTTFQFFSILLSVFLGLSAVVFARTYKLGKKFEAALLLLLYLGGDLNPFVLFVLGQGFHFRMGAMESGADLLSNYPRAFATIFVFIVLALLKLWHDKRTLRLEILMALLIAAAVCSKINTGALLIVGISVLSVYYLIKKQPQRLSLLFFTGFFTAALFLPVNKNAGGLIYTGFWRARDYIVQPELGLSHLELARQVYEEHNNVLRVWQHHLMFLALFVLATFGTKLLGLIQTRQSLKQLPLFLHIVLMSGMFVCFICGMFFIQVSGGANSFNFLSTVFIFLSIYAALFLAFVVTKIPYNLLLYGLLALVFLLTVPRSFYLSGFIYNAAFNNNLTYLPAEKLRLLNRINKEIPPSAVFLKGDFPLSYLGRKHIYFADGYGLGVLQSHGINTAERESLYKKIMADTNVERKVKRLKTLGITHMILTTDTSPLSTLSAQTTLVLKEGETKIIKLK